MTLGGELVSLLVSLAQELGIVVGVGALTLTLIGHLLSLHANQNEVTRRYVRAAHHLRAMALFVIVLSGAGAVALHILSGSFATLMAPAFVFKLLLIALIVVLHFTEWNVSGVKQDVVEGFEGASWYALFIVHTLAPMVGWAFLLMLYAGWVVTFGILWAVFVWIMRGQSIKKQKTPAQPVSKPAPPIQPKPAPVVPVQKPVTPPASKSVPPPVVQKPTPPATPKPVPPPAPVVQKPAPAPAAKVEMPVPGKIEVHPNHSMLPMLSELDLPAPKHAAPAPPAPKAPEPKHVTVPPPPPPPAAAPAPKPLAVEVVPEFPTTPVPMRGLEDAGLPALHVMPKRPEDIGSSKRGPVVKMDTE